MVPVPVVVIPSGTLVNVQVPDEGNPLNTTLPVARLHVGCTMVPMVGTVGVTGCALITTLADDPETHVDALVTV
jgi:hypothetical protein